AAGKDIGASDDTEAARAGAAPAGERPIREVAAGGVSNVGESLLARTEAGAATTGRSGQRAEPGGGVAQDRDDRLDIDPLEDTDPLDDELGDTDPFDDGDRFRDTDPLDDRLDDTDPFDDDRYGGTDPFDADRYTSELQSRENLVCRLLLEKKNEECGRHQMS